ncbi:hypothetical protein BDB01DRAFT_774481 [Pilobolus umbonatus]|nr:hypothetical protein BDB01DRAFT_774481 [Pilobolus umbonatus]
MYNGIGLSTPRGSGTNGYVVRNLSHVRAPQVEKERNTNDIKHLPAVKKANLAILEHDRKRKIEVKCMELQLKLEDEGLEEEEIMDKVDELRKKLQEDSKKEDKNENRRFLEHETHHIAAAKEKDNEKMRRALKVGRDYVEGSAFDRELQAKLRDEARVKREADIEIKAERESKRRR